MKKTSYPENGKEIVNKATGNDSIYFHMCNGGPSFEWDKNSSLLIISADSEGWLSSEISFPMHIENLRELAAWLDNLAWKAEA